MKKISLYVVIFTFTFAAKSFAQTSLNTLDQSTAKALIQMHLNQERVNPNDAQNLIDITAQTQGKPLIAATLNGTSVSYIPYQLSPGEVVYGTPQGVPVKTSKEILVGLGQQQTNSNAVAQNNTSAGSNGQQTAQQGGMNDQTMQMLLQSQILDKQIQLAQIEAQKAANDPMNAYKQIDAINAAKDAVEKREIQRKFAGTYTGPAYFTGPTPAGAYWPGGAARW